MRTTALTLMAVLALAACSKADNSKVSQAGADLKAAGTETTDAAKNLASAASHDLKSAGDQTGKALKNAGAKVKQTSDDAGKDSKNSID
jgi:hypothetical protein